MLHKIIVKSETFIYYNIIGRYYLYCGQIMNQFFCIYNAIKDKR